MRTTLAVLLGAAACALLGCGEGVRSNAIASSPAVSVPAAADNSGVRLQPVGNIGVLAPLTLSPSPVPVIVSVAPASVLAGSAAAIVVTGSGFTHWTTLQVDGASRGGTVLDDQHLSVSLLPSDTQQATVLRLQLQTDAAQGGGPSNIMPYVVSNPAPSLLSLGTTDFAAGSASARLAVAEAGLLPGATATVDGIARQVVAVDASSAAVAVASADLLYAARRAVRLVNPGPGDARSAPLWFTVHNQAKRAREYYAFGDSNTSGYGPAGPLGLAYPNLLAAANNLQMRANMAGFGVEACDLFPAQILPPGVNGAAGSRAVYTVMVGENDLLQRGAGAHEATFNLCHQAALAWLAVPAESKVWMGRPGGLTVAGGCQASLENLVSYYCGSGGSVSVAGLTTQGHPLYVWYLIDDGADTAAAFDVFVDGVRVSTGKPKLAEAVSTAIGLTRSVGVLRIPISAGVHNVQAVTAAGGVGVLGFASQPADASNAPFVIVGDVLPGLQGAGLYDATSQAKYNADIRANILQLQADGLDIRFAPASSFLSGSAEEMADPVHLSILGHQHLAAAFQTGFADLLQ